jgi:uncharacterized membrane protein
MQRRQTTLLNTAIKWCSHTRWNEPIVLEAPDMGREKKLLSTESDGRSDTTSSSVSFNVDTVAAFERKFLRQRMIPERVADAIGEFAGSFVFVIFHLLWFSGWSVVNLGLIPDILPFDAFPFAILQILVSLEAIFLSTFVLMRQNRLNSLADQRAHLDLQINLLAEKESTKMLQMLQAVCDRLGLEKAAQDKETQQLSEETHLETLARELEEKLPSKPSA